MDGKKGGFFLVVPGLRCCVCGLSLVGQGGSYSLLWLVGSVAVVQGLSCSEALWNLPGPGITPMSPALAGRFLTTGSPGKSSIES